MMLYMTIAYRVKRMTPTIPSKNSFSKLQNRKKLQSTPNAFWNLGNMRVMYNGIPLVSRPNPPIQN